MPRLSCVDEPLEFNGDWNTANAQFLFLYFNGCNSTTRSTCKSYDEIHLWLKGKQLVLVHNKVVFNQTSYKEKEVQRFSFIEWIPFNNDLPTINPYAIQITELTTADSWIPTLRAPKTQTYTMLQRLPSFTWRQETDLFTPSHFNGIFLQMSTDQI